MKTSCDVLIVGSGAAGLTAGIALAQENLKVIVATKDAVTESSSTYAQGGIAVAISEDDSIESHVQDTLRVGCGLADLAIVREYLSEIESRIYTMASWGIPFSGLGKGVSPSQGDLAHEAAHSHARVLKVGGDLSGRVLMKSLWEAACRHDSLSIAQGTTLVDLHRDDSGNCVGGRFTDINYSSFDILASSTIIATGGFAGLYAHSTNPEVSSGDGLACAARIGATLRDLEFVQFHPTVLLASKRFLLSEALRGAGAIIVNSAGERCLSKHLGSSAEMNCRADVSLAIWKELQRGEQVYLDTTGLGKNSLISKFNGIYSHCLELGYDLAEAPVPITPAAHYCIGGIAVDAECKTGVPGLWAIGEAANTGLHGADRLASNSLLECIVSAFRACESIKGFKSDYVFHGDIIAESSPHLDRTEISEKQALTIMRRLKETYWNMLGIVRTPKGLQEASNYFSHLKNSINITQGSNSIILNELRNAILLGQLMSDAALARKQSIGVHRIQGSPNQST